MRAALVIAVLAALGGRAVADDAERTFEDAIRHEAAGDPKAIELFEALGAALPTSAWADDAWVEAARLAERAGDLARARRDYQRAIALDADPRLVDRARADLARLVANTGNGRWDKVAAAHERLESEVYSGGDPRPALRELEALVGDNPDYPRRGGVILVIAEGWERDGDAARAIHGLETAQVSDPTERERIGIALMHALIRHRDLDRAGDLLAAYEREPYDRAVAGELHGLLRRARLRSSARLASWLWIAIAAGLAVVGLRRGAGSWRAIPRRLMRPPAEVWFLAPVALVLAGVAATGNPMVGPAVWQILAAGVAIAWVSGTILDLVRGKRPIRARRVIVHAALAVVTAAAVAYVALDHDALLDLIAETYTSGPAMR